MLETTNGRLPPLIEEERFITMCCGVVDSKTMELRYALAGHPPPLWARRDAGTVVPLEGKGDVIGVHENPEFEERSVTLRPGDTAVGGYSRSGRD